MQICGAKWMAINDRMDIYMTYTLINYIPFYYETIVKARTPSLIMGKFVLMRHEKALVLILSPKDFTKYHANIVERFCLDKGLEGNWDAQHKSYSILDTAWSVAGGGKLALDATRKTIKFFDDSMAYGKFDASLLRNIIASVPDFQGYAIKID